MITKFSYALTMLSAAMLNAAEFFTKGKADTRLKEQRARAEIRGEELWKEIDDTHWLKKPVMDYPGLLKGYVDFGAKKVVSEPGLLNTYENYMNEQGPNALTPFAQGLKDIIKDKKNDPKSLNLKALHDLIAVEEKNGYRNHEDHEENRRYQESPQFLERSANAFGDTISRILGMDEGESFADFHETLKEANQQRAEMALVASRNGLGGMGTPQESE